MLGYGIEMPTSAEGLKMVKFLRVALRQLPVCYLSLRARSDVL